MKIQPIIFSHAPDSACAVEAAGALIEAGMPAPWIYSEHRSPITPNSTVALEQMGCTIRPLDYPTTVAGQYGRNCVVGISSAYMEAASETSAEYVLKVDSDTVVLRSDKLYSSAESGVVAAAGWSWLGWCFSGCCALIHRDLAKYINDYARSSKPLPENLKNEDCPQDMVDYYLAQEFGPINLWPYSAEGGLGAGYQYQHSEVSLLEYGKRFDSVTFGQRYYLEGEDHERRSAVASTMSAFRTICRNNNLINRAI